MLIVSLCNLSKLFVGIIFSFNSIYRVDNVPEFELHDILVMLDTDEQEITSKRWKMKYKLLIQFIRAFRRDKKYDIKQIEKCLTSDYGTEAASRYVALNN